MLVVGATSALRLAGKRKFAPADWIAALRARKSERLVAVALANKLARIGWAIMTAGEVFPPGDLRQEFGKCVVNLTGLRRTQRDLPSCERTIYAARARHSAMSRTN